jgi:pre-mRNA-processing factor 39
MLQRGADESLRPPSVSVFSKSKAGAKENGLTTAELDESTKVKAEAKYWNFYDLHGDADPDAQGQASFN